MIEQQNIKIFVLIRQKLKYKLAVTKARAKFKKKLIKKEPDTYIAINATLATVVLIWPP